MKNIINLLKKKKFIPLDRFINIALYDKKFGYYNKYNPFGKDGDYITSPLVSNLFGEMIAIWCVAFWENLGKPKKIIILEMGPGDGKLCNDLLKAFKNFEHFYNCLEIKLIEKSAKLKKIQKKKIKNNKVLWIKKIQELNKGPVIFLCNEFFDALPIKQIYIKKKLFFEKFVGLDKSEKKIKFLKKHAKKCLVKNINKLKLNSNGGIVEYPAEAIKYLELMAKKINELGGGLLIIDYGYTVQKNINTLQSVRNHKYINILSKPGLSDITHHINYQLFLKTLNTNNLTSENVVTQNEFLQKLGIINRANILSNKISFKEKTNIFYQLNKLLNPNEMGKLFKVLFAHRKNVKFSLGFK